MATLTSKTQAFTEGWNIVVDDPDAYGGTIGAYFDERGQAQAPANTVVVSPDGQTKLSAADFNALPAVAEQPAPDQPAPDQPTEADQPAADQPAPLDPQVAA